MDKRIKKKKQKQLIERGWTIVYNKHQALSRDKMEGNKNEQRNNC